MARGVASRLAALQRTDSPRIQGFPQSYVQLPGHPANTSIRRTKIDPIEAAKAQKRPLATCAAGKLLCTASHLAVCLSTREAGPDAARRTDAHQAGQSKRRDRLRLGTSFHANDPRAYGTTI